MKCLYVIKYRAYGCVNSTSIYHYLLIVAKKEIVVTNFERFGVTKRFSSLCRIDEWDFQLLVCTDTSEKVTTRILQKIPSHECVQN